MVLAFKQLPHGLSRSGVAGIVKEVWSTASSCSAPSCFYSTSDSPSPRNRTYPKAPGGHTSLCSHKKILSIGARKTASPRKRYAAVLPELVGNAMPNIFFRPRTRAPREAKGSALTPSTPAAEALGKEDGQPPIKAAVQPLVKAPGQPLSKVSAFRYPKVRKRPARLPPHPPRPSPPRKPVAAALSAVGPSKQFLNRCQRKQATFSAKESQALALAPTLPTSVNASHADGSKDPDVSNTDSQERPGLLKSTFGLIRSALESVPDIDGEGTPKGPSMTTEVDSNSGKKGLVTDPGKSSEHEQDGNNLKGADQPSPQSEPAPLTSAERFRLRLLTRIAAEAAFVSASNPATNYITPAATAASAGSEKPAKMEEPNRSMSYGAASTDGVGANAGAHAEPKNDAPAVSRSPFRRRPTLQEISSSQIDELPGHYKSQTAWNSKKDHALTNKGLEMESQTELLIRKGRKFITVIIDGDNLWFNPQHMRLGYPGGQIVVEELKQRIAKKHSLDPETLELRIRIFCAYAPLQKVLHISHVVDRGMLTQFFYGLMDSGHHNYVVHLCKGDQAADKRVRTALADAVTDPGCYRVYLGGLDDFGYMADLRALDKRGLLAEKVRLIQVPGYAVDSQIYRKLASNMVDLDYLFMSQPRVMDYVERNPLTGEVNKKEYTKLMPCVWHHLMGRCNFEDKCEYSHEPIFEDQKEALRLQMKRRKCTAVERGQVCKFGDECMFAH